MHTTVLTQMPRGVADTFLKYGRHPMLLINYIYGVQTPDILASTAESIHTKLQSRLQQAYKTAQEVNKKEIAQSKCILITKSDVLKLEPGDVVLV